MNRAATLLEELRSLGCSLGVGQGNRLAVDAPRGVIGAGFRQRIVADREGLIELLRPPEELEAVLAGVEVEARRLTTDPRLLGAVANLLEDCRAFWREGKQQTAMFLSRDYITRIPAYLAGRMASRRPA